MKRILFCMLFTALTMGVCGQQADKVRKILDKTATIVGHKGGASASFSIQSSNVGTTKGTIAIKGNMFHVSTDKATIWYNGKTQWTYMKATNEVNITTPNAAKQAQLNPYKFLSLYKTGYQLSMKSMRAPYLIHLTAIDKQLSPQEFYITISKTYVPTLIKMRQASNWTTIRISNFKQQEHNAALFSFQSKDFPKAEIIDLR